MSTFTLSRPRSPQRPVHLLRASPPLPGLERGALPFAPFGRHKEAAAGLYSCPKSPIPQHVFTIQVTGRTTSSPTRATTPARAERNRAMSTELCCVNTYHMLGHLRTFVVAPPTPVRLLYPPTDCYIWANNFGCCQNGVGQRAAAPCAPRKRRDFIVIYACPRPSCVLPVAGASLRVSQPPSWLRRRAIAYS